MKCGIEDDSINILRMFAKCDFQICVELKFPTCSLHNCFYWLALWYNATGLHWSLCEKQSNETHHGIFHKESSYLNTFLKSHLVFTPRILYFFRTTGLFNADLIRFFYQKIEAKSQLLRKYLSWEKVRHPACYTAQAGTIPGAILCDWCPGAVHTELSLAFLFLTLILYLFPLYFWFLWECFILCAFASCQKSSMEESPTWSKAEMQACIHSCHHGLTAWVAPVFWCLFLFVAVVSSWIHWCF